MSFVNFEMADEEEASALRKQIAFLSNLINSRKTGTHPNRKSALKNHVSSEISRENKKWTNYKQQAALNKNESRSNNPSNVQLGNQTETISDQLTPRTVGRCEDLNGRVPSNKYIYRKPLQTSFTLTKSDLDNSSKTHRYVLKSGHILAEKTKHTTSRRVNSSTSKFAVASLAKKHPTHGASVHILKNVSTNKYKLRRNNGTIKSKLHNSSHHLSTSRNQTIKTQNSTSAGHLIKPQLTARNKSKQSESNFKWLKKLKTSSNSPINIPKNGPRPLTVPKTSKLTWRRKSSTRSVGSSLKKDMLAKNYSQSQIVPNTSNWQRKNTTYNSFPVKRTKLLERKQHKTCLVHKSRYSLKRVRASNERTSGLPRGDLNNSCVWNRTGAVWKRKSNVELRNRSFIARRMKYIAHGSHMQNKLHLLKLSNNAHFTIAGQKRIVRIGGINYRIGSQGKTLQKTDVAKHKKNAMNDVTFNQRQLRSTANAEISKLARKGVNRILVRQSSVDKYKNERASKILRRTIQNVRESMKKDNRGKSKSKQYCMFYNKFGKCMKQKQGTCPYIHDPTKVAVCTRFLRGTCQQMDGSCPFSHKVDKEKMPICQYFLKGKCTRDDCPYSHVNVGRSAVVCEDFLKGYCALGSKCKKKHVLECEEFNTTGHCPNGAKCKLVHRKKNPRLKRYFQELSPSEKLVPKAKKARHRSSDGFLPLEDSTLDNIRESDQLTEPSSSEGAHAQSNVTLQIRPKFAIKSSADW